VKVKALIDALAVSISKNTFSVSEKVFETYWALITPPKRKVYTMPEWEDYLLILRQTSCCEITQAQAKKLYNEAREALAKEE
jgi:hypothetical protein